MEDYPKKITENEFLKDLNDFKCLDPVEKKEIFNLAWDSRKFEIELYWKRAGYFWAFQAVALAGYVAIVSSSNTGLPNYIEFYSQCIGFITALGWFLINKGSKSWQRHWEKIIDILEDHVVGKLYKTSTTPKTYSVSKINELISLFFCIMWLCLLLINFFQNHMALEEPYSFNWHVFFASLLVLGIVLSMFFGKGRGRFGERKISLYRRKTIVK